MVGVNVPVPVPMAYYSFGGWKSRCSATRTRTAPRACTSTPAARSSPARWLDPSHGGLDLGFPQNT